MGPLLKATAAMTAPPVNIPAVKMNSVFISTNSFLPHGFRENSKINAIFARSNTGRMTQNAKQYLLAAAVVLIAINLRAPITSVGPVLPEISLALDLSRSEEHTSELQSLMRLSYAVFCLKKKQPRQVN